MALDLAEQILAGFQAALVSQVTGIDARVERDREDGFGETEYALGEGAVNIKPDDETSRVFGTMADDNQLNVDVEIYVRALQNENWTTKANAFAVLIHARLMAYAWPAFIPAGGDGKAMIRRAGRSWGSDETGRTPGRLTISYAVRYLSHARALDSSPTQP